MQRTNRVITAVTVLVVTLANAGVLEVVHLRQHGVGRSASGDPQLAAGHRAGAHHDPSTCPFCLQFASGNKTVSPHLGTPVSLTADVTKDVVFPRTLFVPGVFLPSSPARAPPSICL